MLEPSRGSPFDAADKEHLLQLVREADGLADAILCYCGTLNPAQHAPTCAVALARQHADNLRTLAQGNGPKETR